MGGPGSGPRRDYSDRRRKRLVENALTLDVTELDSDRFFLPHQNGELFWKQAEKKTVRMRSRVDKIDGRSLYSAIITSIEINMEYYL